MAKELDLKRRVPLGHRVRLGGRIHFDAARRCAAAIVRPVPVAGRGEGVPARQGQDTEHESAIGKCVTCSDSRAIARIVQRHEGGIMRLLSKGVLLAVAAATMVAAGPGRGAAEAQVGARLRDERAVSHPVGVGGGGNQEAQQRQVRHPGLPRELARQGDRHQPGAGAGHRRHDHQRAVVRRAELPAHRHRLLSVHLPRRRSPDRLLEEPGVRRNGRRLPRRRPASRSPRTRTTVRGRRRPTGRSPTAPA